MLKVRNLQEQIVRATMNNEMKKVYDLQRKLVTSFEGGGGTPPPPPPQPKLKYLICRGGKQNVKKKIY
jgi:hypothetical protein